MNFQMKPEFFQLSDYRSIINMEMMEMMEFLKFLGFCIVVVVALRVFNFLLFGEKD